MNALKLRTRIRCWLRRACGSVLVVTVASATGCATILSSGPEPVVFTSDPDGADVVVNGELKGKTPVTLDLHPEKDHTVVIAKPAYEKHPVTLSTHVQPGWVILDVLAFGLVAITVDAVTGEWKTFDQTSYDAVLTPDPDAEAGDTQPVDSSNREAVPKSQPSGGMCFRGRPPPDCRTYWIAEVGYSASLTSGDNTVEGSHYLMGELGLMFNSGEHYAFGFSAFVGGLGGTGSIGPAMRGGLRARVRRWISGGTAVDLAAGPMYTGTGKLGFSSQLGLSVNDIIMIVATIEAIDRTHDWQEERPDLAVANPVDAYLGIRFGGKAAAVALLAAGAMLGLAGLYSAGY